MLRTMRRGVPRESRLALWRRDGGRCQIPGCPKPREVIPLREATLDHIIRWRDGGNNDLANLRIAHAECNRDRDEMERL